MRKHHLIAALLLLFFGAVHFMILEKKTRAGLAQMPESIRSIPSRIVDYRQVGVDEELDERTAQVLETSTVLMRTYVGETGWPVQLTVVFAGGTRRSLHFPEVCLVGHGWEIREQYKAPVGILFTAKRLVLVNGEQRQAVLYWFKTGEHLTGSYFLNALHWTRNQVSFSSQTSSAMIKLTTAVGPGGEDAAFAVLEDFAQKLQPVLMEHVP